MERRVELFEKPIKDWTLQDWLPAFPLAGPPLPHGLHIYWPGPLGDFWRKLHETYGEGTLSRSVSSRLIPFVYE